MILLFNAVFSKVNLAKRNKMVQVCITYYKYLKAYEPTVFTESWDRLVLLCAYVIWLSVPSAPLTFNIGDLKFRDLAKLCFFKLIMTKSNFKKFFFQFGTPLPIKISGYASVQ